MGCMLVSLVGNLVYILNSWNTKHVILEYSWKWSQTKKQPAVVLYVALMSQDYFTNHEVNQNPVFYFIKKVCLSVVF